MRTQLLILFFLPVIAGYSQRVIDVEKTDYKVSSSLFYTAGGTPVSDAKYIRVVEGSPYFNESYMKGKVVLAEGNTYDSIPMKLDLLDNSLQYLSPDGREMLATSSLKSITLHDSVSGNEYEFVHSNFLQPGGMPETGWYQILGSGQATLCKRIVKKITESRPYGSATVEQVINNMNQYFLIVNSVVTRIKKFKDLPDLLKDKKNELSNYINNKNLSGKLDTDYSALISYYNNLTAK